MGARGQVGAEKKGGFEASSENISVVQDQRVEGPISSLHGFVIANYE